MSVAALAAAGGDARRVPRHEAGPSAPVGRHWWVGTLSGDQEIGSFRKICTTAYRQHTGYRYGIQYCTGCEGI